MKILLLLASLPLFCSPPLAAQERPKPAQAKDAKPPAEEGDRVAKLIEGGLAAWRAGDAAKASDLLQKAVGLIQQQAAQSLAQFLPAAVEGWTLEKPRIDSGTWGTGEQTMQWSNAELELKRDGDGATARIQITNSPQLFQAFDGMVKVQEQMKEMLRQQGQDITIADRGGFKVVTTEQGEQATGLVVGKSLAVFVELRPGKRDQLKQVLDRIDLEGLAKLDRPK